MKKCPYCAEEIQDEAILCRYCQSDLQVPKTKSKPSSSSLKQRSPQSLKKKYFTGLIVILIILVIILFASLSAIQTTPASPTNTPRPTSTLRPNIETSQAESWAVMQTAAAKFEETSEPQGCLPWQEISTVHIGQTICVFGTVHSNKQIAGTTTHITFTKQEGNFFLASGTVYYPEVGKGDCVMAQGKVLAKTYHIPYIDIDDGLKKCNFE